MTTFQNLNLNSKILSALESKGYTTPTPIQLQAIPAVLEGKDLLGIAQTGTGKTAAFSLPILQNLAASNKEVRSNGARALILTPTRELASQIADNIKLYGKDLHLTHTVVFGGVSERPQIATMKRGVDILIATPGRLLDLATQGHIRFSNLEIFVLDEADRMLDMGFFNDVKKIIAKIPEERQTLFFSATMPDAINDLAHSILKDPVKIEITPQSTTVERIEQKLMQVQKGNKLSLLKRILKDEEAQSVLVFSKTKHGANRILEFLEKNSIAVAAIHGNKSQGAREKALASFREGKVQVLIATDIAARGIDVPSISHVINFDIPMDPESYVHRIGRTARAGRQGVAISFCDPSETRLLKAVEKTINFNIPVDTTHAYHGVEAAPSSSQDSNNSDRPRRQNSGQRSGQRSRPASSGEGRSSGDRNRGGRNNDRRSSPHSSERGERSDRRDGKRNFDRKPKRSEDQQPDGTKSSLLNFIGFGKKRAAQSVDRNTPFRVKEEEKGGGFGLGWLKGKKTESRNGGGRDRRNRDEQPSFTGRDGLPQGRDQRSSGGQRNSSGFGGRDRNSSRGGRSGEGFGGRSGDGFGRPNRDRRDGSGFGGNRDRNSRGSDRNDDNRGNSFGNNDRRGNSSFGNSERSSGGFSDRRDGQRNDRRSSNGDRKPFGDRNRKPFGDRRPSGGGSFRPQKSW